MEKIYKNKITKKHYELIEKIPETLLGRFRMIEDGYTYTIPFEDMIVCENNERRASRREGKATNEQSKTAESIMKKVDSISDTIKEISDKLVEKYCGELDEEMKKIGNLLICSQNMTDNELDFEILNLANILYFVGAGQEDLGIKEDTCKAIRQEVYSTAREQAIGKTVADKTAQAELIAQAETMTLAIYSRAYKKVKLRMDAGYEMLNSLKKVMNKRITEMELSNSRYINKSEV